MSGSRSKQKGNRFERELSKILSETYKEEFEVEQSFRRSITSGSFFGGKNRSRANMYIAKNDISDIMCPESFKYTIECKHYKEAPSFNAIITQSCSQWDKWIKQASMDAKTANKKFMLVVKYDNIKPMVFLEDNFKDSFIFRYKDLYIYNFDAFLKEFKYDLLEK